MLDPYDYFAEQPDGRRNAVDVHRHRVNLQMHQRFRMRDTQDPLNISVNEFVKIYRLPQHEVVNLTNILAPYVPERTSPQATPLLTKVMVALSVYAGGTYQRMLGRSGDSSVCQSSVSRYVREVTMALNHPEILTRFVRFPMTHAEREEVIQRNFRLGMPRVLGFIDGTLVRIVPPHLHKQDYYCRKGFTAINAQIICDADLNIMNVNALFPGSCNDMGIWGLSAARDVVEQAYFESRCWLLGDGGYFVAPWLHVPLPHAPPGTPEYEYTKLHVHCRNAVERCIGVLKAIWRCLCMDRAITYNPTTAGSIINACCVLHNFCLTRGLPLPNPIRENVPLQRPDFDDLPENLQARALAEQNFLIHYAYQRRRE